MSHELRTPLNAILGFAQLLEMDELPAEQASSVDQIQVAGRHLLSLINEVLDISRIEAGQPVDETGRSQRVLDEVTTLLAPVAEAAGVELSIDIDGSRVLRVHADRQRLLQVLLNLGSNAVKYNSRGGSVAFRPSRPTTVGVRFEVHDTGPGHPPRTTGPAVRALLEARGRALRRRGDRGRPGPLEAARRSDGRRHRRAFPGPRLDVLGRAAPGRRAPSGRRRRRTRARSRSVPGASSPAPLGRERPARARRVPGPDRPTRGTAGTASVPSCSRSRTTPRTPPWSNRSSPPPGVQLISAGKPSGPRLAPNIGLTWSFSTSTCPTCPVTSCCTGSRRGCVGRHKGSRGERRRYAEPDQGDARPRGRGLPDEASRGGGAPPPGGPRVGGLTVVNLGNGPLSVRRARRRRRAANVALIESILYRPGLLHVLGTTDSRDFRRLFLDQRPDAVLLDLHMPHVNGLDAPRARSPSCATPTSTSRSWSCPPTPPCRRSSPRSTLGPPTS